MLGAVSEAAYKQGCATISFSILSPTMEIYAYRLIATTEMYKVVVLLPVDEMTNSQPLRSTSCYGNAHWSDRQARCSLALSNHPKYISRDEVIPITV
jgi:hypothetical protein